MQHMDGWVEVSTGWQDYTANLKDRGGIER